MATGWDDGDDEAGGDEPYTYGQLPAEDRGWFDWRGKRDPTERYPTCRWCQADFRHVRPMKKIVAYCKTCKSTFNSLLTDDCKIHEQTCHTWIDDPGRFRSNLRCPLCRRLFDNVNTMQRRDHVCTPIRRNVFGFCTRCGFERVIVCAEVMTIFTF